MKRTTSDGTHIFRRGSWSYSFGQTSWIAALVAICANSSALAQQHLPTKTGTPRVASNHGHHAGHQLVGPSREAHIPSSSATYFGVCKTCTVCGVHCNDGNCACEPGWDVAGPIPWEIFAQGEYVGPHRLAHVPEYRLRTDDVLEFVYRITGIKSSRPYRLQTGDRLSIDSLSAEEYSRIAVVQPDGYISMPLIGEVMAADLTIPQLRAKLEEAYQQDINLPKFSVSASTQFAAEPLDQVLQELRATVDARAGDQGGQSRSATVTPEGTVQLPAIGSVHVNGLTLDELGREIDQRYSEIVEGLEVTPILLQRAPRFVYVLGEVNVPGRYAMEGPTSLMQSIALAGGWTTGAAANLNKVVVFRRDENWCLMATQLDIRGALYGKRPCPADEIWLRDSDIVLLPKRKSLIADEWIELIFTRGIYGVIPFGSTLDYAALGSL